MDISAYRRATFALCKALGMTEEMRHDFNFKLTGKYSSSDFSVDDWRLVVSKLQQLAGQGVKLGNPRMRSHREGTPGGMISPAQLEYLDALRTGIAWRTSPEQFIRSRLLSPLRRANWNGHWETLFRSEATAAISAFRRMAGSAGPSPLGH